MTILYYDLFDRGYRFQMMNISVQQKINMHISFFPHLPAIFLVTFLYCITGVTTASEKDTKEPWTKV